MYTVHFAFIIHISTDTYGDSENTKAPFLIELFKNVRSNFIFWRKYHENILHENLREIFTRREKSHVGIKLSSTKIRAENTTENQQHHKAGRVLSYSCIIGILSLRISPSKK